MSAFNAPYAAMPATTVWWEGGWDSPAAMQADIDKAKAWEAQAPARWDQYVQQAGGIGNAAPVGSTLDSQIAGGYTPAVDIRPSGHAVLATPHWDGGSTTYSTADGRTVRDRLGDYKGHWDNQTQDVTGYTLHDPGHKSAADWGLKLTPEQQQALGNKTLTRYEKFNNAGKNEGYGYDIYDDRGFFKSFIQDLGPVLLAPFMSVAAPALAGGIGSLMPGLSATTSQALAGGLLGGTVSKLGGGDFVKGALAGGLGGAVSGWNPAGQMGVTGAMQKPINAAITGAGRAVLSGQGLDDALKAQLTNPSFLLSAAGSAADIDIGGWVGAVQLANAVKNGDPAAIMQAVRIVGAAQGKAAGGLIGEAGPDRVEASRILRDLPPDQARMLSGIAANF